MKRLTVLLLLSAAAGLAGCERAENTKVPDPMTNGVGKNEALDARPVDLTLLDDQRALFDARTRGGGGAGTRTTPSPTRAPAGTPGPGVAPGAGTPGKAPAGPATPASKPAEPGAPASGTLEPPPTP